MNIPQTALLTILILMSLVAGVAKIIQMPQELHFLAHLGLSAKAVTWVGLAQFSGGVLLIPPRTRLGGAILAVAALMTSELALFTAGQVAVGLITLFPLAIGVSIIIENLGRKP